jgi:uncharacterized membrane protein
VFEDVLAEIRWPLLLATVTIVITLAFFGRRKDVRDRVGLTPALTAILCLGPLAGLTLNLPVYQSGAGLLAVNLGGALVPVCVVALWLRRGHLKPLPALAGTFVVSLVANVVTVYDPDLGVYSTFPQMFAPSLVALSFALIATVRGHLRAIPLAYASGSMGALLGADLYNLPAIVANLDSPEGLSVVSIGGAGVFDMVYLAGMIAMDAAMVIVWASLPKRAATPAEMAAYGALPVPQEPPRAVWERYRALQEPTPMERARASLALSDLYLQRHDYARCVGHAYGAVYALAGTAPGAWQRARLRGAAMQTDIDALLAAYRESLERPTPRSIAGNANRAAKQVVAALEAMAGIPREAAA